MKTVSCRTILTGLLLALAVLVPEARAQRRENLPPFLLDPAYRSSRTAEKKALMDGNEVSITFFNYGLLGGTGEVRGNWPKGSRDFYVGDVLPVISAEVPVDMNQDGRPDTLVHHAVTVRGPRAGQNSPPGNPNIFWGFEAKPGFAATDPNDKPALSTDPATWPSRWPDQPLWYDPATGLPAWNGFFGRGIQNADLETYFWIDDQNDDELFSKYQFLPDSTDATRRGLGLSVKVRGMQWSQFLAQDAIFWLYEVTNTSTTTYPRVSVGLTVGTLAGGDNDSQDDLAFFDQANRIVYSWDFDNSGNERQPVGYVGYGFMESPGDASNAIDDDGDGDPTTELGLDVNGMPFVPLALAGADNTFNSNDFLPRTLSANDPIILIDERTGERSIVYLGNGKMQVTSQGITRTIEPGQVLEENKQTLRGQIDEIIVTERNLIDEDLDGVIDEDVNLHFTRRAQEFSGEIKELPAVRYKNYVGFANAIRNRAATTADSAAFGLLNPMIDEDRADLIDNDHDWDIIADDVGADGAAGTGDEGESDGVPTPGEPNFDALDVDESDQVGLSSFFYFTPPGAVRMNDDERLWGAMAPGFFTTNRELQAQQAGGVDGDFIFSSGYFRMEPGQTMRFSMALVFGNDLQDITNNTKTIQEIYDRNYQFARPPERPRLYAVPGDGRVTLYWDTRAEESIDPVLGRDFEGYRIYKSTDPYFKDPQDITDAFGGQALMAPLAQFDLANGVRGLWMPGSTNNLYERVRGTPYYLGGDSGLRHSYVDTLVENGRRYYYALTAYDRGNIEFYPAENNFAVRVEEDGSVVTGPNVVEVMPNAPVAGYSTGGLKTDVTHEAGPATGESFVEVLDPLQLDEGKRYSVRFTGDGLSASNFVVESGGETVAEGPIAESESVIFDGMRLRFNNDQTQLDLDNTKWTVGENKVSLFVQEPVNIPEWRFEGVAVPYDYEIRFTAEPSGNALAGVKLGQRGPLSTAMATYFNVFNVTLNRPAQFVFIEPSAATRNGKLEGNEFIFIYEDVNGQLMPTAAIRPEKGSDGNFGPFPTGGEVFRLATMKPFSTADRFTFEVQSSKVNTEDAQAQLDRIRVVPNPYVASASWERPLPQTINSGRGERRLDFINLPAGSVVRIYTVRGELVRELRHDAGAIGDGTVHWDLRTREDLDVAYGVYFYHVDAPGVGEKTGKLAIIK